MVDKISARNPDLEEMREQGYAWVLRSTLTGDYGAPHTGEEFAAEGQRRMSKDELLIISFDE